MCSGIWKRVVWESAANGWTGMTLSLMRQRYCIIFQSLDQYITEDSTHLFIIPVRAANISNIIFQSPTSIIVSVWFFQSTIYLFTVFFKHNVPSAYFLAFFRILCLSVFHSWASVLEKGALFIGFGTIRRR